MARETWFNNGGTWVKASEVYLNVSGVWKNAVPYIFNQYDETQLGYYSFWSDDGEQAIIEYIDADGDQTSQSTYNTIGNPVYFWANFIVGTSNNCVFIENGEFSQCFEFPTTTTTTTTLPPGSGYYNCGYGCQYYSYDPGCSHCLTSYEITSSGNEGYYLTATYYDLNNILQYVNVYYDNGYGVQVCSRTYPEVIYESNDQGYNITELGYC